MNPKELKTALKPIVKELIYECLITEGILSSVVSEVMKGTTNKQMVSESVSPTKQPIKQNQKFESNEEAAARRKKLEESMKSKLGVNIFEGTTPLTSRGHVADSRPSETKALPLSNIAPDDPGVDISGLLSITGGWKQIK